jgi:4-amino-4-deoxy-L-arabinose transferase-like glycosyltransferase
MGVHPSPGTFGMARLIHTRFAHYILLLTVAAALTLPGLGAASLWDIDEGLNAEAAREMLESGDWVVPTFNFQPRTAKPALLYWLQALSYKQFGVNEFAARLPSALAGAIVVLLTYEFGRRMFGPAVGLLAGIIVASTVQVSLLAHAATPDAVLLACLMLTLWLFWTGVANGSRRWAWATGLGCGLAMLAKGPIGVLMPAAIGGYYFLAQRQARRLLEPRLLLGLLLVILIAGPWYALVGAETRGRFLKSFWENEHVGRFLAPMEGHSGPMWYYLVAILVGLGTWSVVIAPTLRDALRSTNRQDGEPNAVRFLVCWAAVYVGIFSLAQTKLPNYVLPAYPPLALLTARFLDRWRRGAVEVFRGEMTAAMVVLAVIGVAITGGLLMAGGVMTPIALRGQEIAGLARWAWVGTVPVIAAVIGYRYLRQGSRAGVVASLCAAAIGFVGLATALPVRAVESVKAPRELVGVAGAYRPTDEVRIAQFGYFQPSLVFYCQREITSLYTPQQAVDLLHGPLPAYVFCTATVGDALADRGSGRVAARRFDLFRGAEVVVVTNR